MQVRWLGFVQRQALRSSLGSSSRPRALWPDLAPYRNIAGQAGQSHVLDLKFEEQFFPIKPLSVIERRLLGKARLNGIDSLEKLEYEAQIGNTIDIGSRMTDKSGHRQDLDLWRLLLEFNQHRRGVDGAKAIWVAMMYRGKPVELETRNRNASDLVQAIIISAVADPSFLKRFCMDCIHRDIFPDQLFVWVVGTLLLLEPKASPSLTVWLKDPCFRGKGDLLELARIACQSDKADVFDRFCQLRSHLPDFQIYDDVMPEVWNAQRSSDAFTLHRCLLSRGDLPKTFETLKPFVQHIVTTDGSIETFLRGLATAEVSFEAQIRRYHAILINDTSTDPSQPRKPSDETIARTMATFPFDFAIQSLKFFGLIEVGPLSVRQIVKSSPNSKVLKDRFEVLKEDGIDTGSSAYVRLLKKLSNNGVFRTAKYFAECDMHHDEFENRDLQRRLLKHYYIHADRRRMNNTLTIIHQGRIDLEAQSKSANLLLRSAIAGKDWRKVLLLVNQICQKSFTVEDYTLDFLVQTLLPQKSVVEKSFDRTAFLIGILQRLLAAGVAVQPRIWLRPLIALGSKSRLEESERLAIWLADWYSPSQTMPSTSQRSQQRRIDGDLSKLFTPGLQRAFVSWGFTKNDWKESSKLRTSVGHHSLPNASLVPWLWGPRLLKRLRDEHDVHVDVAGLQKIYFSQIAALPSTSRRLRVVANRRHYAAEFSMLPNRFVQSWRELWGVEVSDSPLLARWRRGYIGWSGSEILP